MNNRIDMGIKALVFKEGKFLEHDGYQWINTDENSLKMVYEVFRLRMLNWNWDEIKGICNL